MVSSNFSFVLGPNASEFFVHIRSFRYGINNLQEGIGFLQQFL